MRRNESGIRRKRSGRYAAYGTPGCPPGVLEGQKCRDALSSWMQGRCRDKARCYRYSNRSRGKGSTPLRDDGRGPTAAAARTGPETPDRPYRLITPALIEEPRRWLRAAGLPNTGPRCLWLRGSSLGS